MITNNKSQNNQFALSQLQEDIKSDLMTIPTLKFGIVSARDFYGSLGIVMLKLSLIFLGINTVIHGVLHAFGHYNQVSLGSIFATWFFAVIGAFIVTLAMNQIVLFSQLVKGRLKTEAVIRKKYRQLILAYLTIYSVGYLLASADLYSFGQMTPNDWSAFALIFSQFTCTIGALIFTSVFASIEMQRIGLGALSEVVQAFVAKAKSHPSASGTNNGGNE